MSDSTMNTIDLVLCVPMGTVLRTRRCLLRCPVFDDAPRLLSAFRSPHFPRLLPLGQIRTRTGVESWINEILTAWENESAYTWSVERAEDIGVLGQVTLSKSEGQNHWAIAFWIHPDSWGHGYATEASARVMEFAFLELVATSIRAGAATWNLTSMRVLEKLGMIPVGDNPKGYVIKGEAVPTKEYEISNNGWHYLRERGLLVQDSTSR
jgi:RimJ/RimL family protein N-acetyltransferase